MAAINFPSSPTSGQSYTENGQTWYYDGVKWVSGGTFGQSALTPMYQQGLWTPTMTAGTPGSSSFVPNVNNTGIWCRVGNLITLTGNLTGTWTAGTAGGQSLIADLPYVCSSTPVNGGYGSATIGYFAGVGVPGNKVFTSGVVPVNSSYIGLYFSEVNQDALIGSSIVGYNNIAQGSDQINIHFSATYFTGDTTWTPINGATVS